MKSRLLISVFSLLVMMSSNAAHAGSKSELERCQAGAGERYDACNSQTNKYGQTNNCDAKYDRAMDACLSRYNDRTEAENNGARYDSSGRFTPTPIPQRPTY